MIVSNLPGQCSPDTRAQHMSLTFERKNRVRCAGSKGTRPETANGCAFALTIPAIAARYGVSSIMPEEIRKSVETVKKSEIDKRKKVWEDKEGPVAKKRKQIAEKGMALPGLPPASVFPENAIVCADGVCCVQRRRRRPLP